VSQLAAHHIVAKLRAAYQQTTTTTSGQIDGSVKLQRGFRPILLRRVVLMQHCNTLRASDTGAAATPSWTRRLPDKSSGSTSLRLSFQSRIAPPPAATFWRFSKNAAPPTDNHRRKFPSTHERADWRSQAPRKDVLPITRRSLAIASEGR
jgi:hypothetical protein